MSRINRVKFGIDEYISPGEYLDLLSQNGADADQLKIDAVNREIAVKESLEHVDGIMTGVMQHKTARNSIIRGIDSVYEDGKNIIFKSVLCEAFIKSLPLDAPHVEAETQRLSEVMCDYVDENGGFAMLENAFKKHGDKVPFIKRFYNLCMESSREVASRIMRESLDDPELTQGNIFKLNDDEKRKLNHKKENLSIDQISKSIKDNVVRVVGEEIDRGKEKKELMAELDEATSQEEAVTEAYDILRGDASPYHDSTLYSALLAKNYKAALSDIKAVMEASRNESSLNNDDFGDQLIGTTDDVPEPMKNDIDMDMIMCESIVDLTVLDTVRTLRLKDFTAGDVRDTAGQLMR